MTGNQLKRTLPRRRLTIMAKKNHIRKVLRKNRYIGKTTVSLQRLFNLKLIRLKRQQRRLTKKCIRVRRSGSS